MIRQRKLFRSMILFGVLGLLAASATTQAEPPAKEEQPAKEQPKEKKPITVSAGTAIMVKTGEEVSSNDQAGRRFSATLQSNLMSGDVVVAKSGSQVYGRVAGSKSVGRGIVVSHSDLVLNLTDINVDGTMYPIITGSFSENTTSVILRKRSVVVPAGSILEFKLTQPLTVKK